MLVTLVLAVSILLQFVAVYFALRLIKITGKSLAWSLIAAAIALMALRRSVSFSHIFFSEAVPMPDLSVELIALAISALMMIGIERITPIIVEMRAAYARQREQNSRYQTIFEHSPVAIWEEDFSGIKSLFGRLQSEGVTDISTYLAQNPEFVQKCARQVKVVDVNRASLILHGAADKEALLAGLVDTFTPESFDTFREELLCLWRGDTEMRRDAVVKTLAGELRQVTVNYIVCPGYETSLAKVFVSLVDITERKDAELQLNQALEELRASEQRFRAIFENSFQFIGLMTTDGWLLEANNAALNLSGIEAHEVLGKPFWETPWWSHSTELQQQLRESIQQAAGGRFVRFEVTHPDKDGTIHYIDFSLTPVTDTSGQVVQLIPEGRDITKHKQAEQARLIHADLLVNLDRVNRAIQSADDLETMMRDVLDEVLDIFDCDRTYLLYPCDPAAATFSLPMERTRPEFPGASVTGGDIPVDSEVSATMASLLNAPGVLQFGPGTTRPVPASTSERYGFKSFMAIALSPKTGKAWEFGIQQCSHTRIWSQEEEQLLTEIARRLTDGLTSMLAQRDLRESEARYQRLFNTANEGIWIQDENFVTTFANEHMAEMLGYTAAELLGRKVTEFMVVEDALEHEHKMDERSRNISDVYERRLLHKDGSAVWMLISATPVFEGDRFHGSFAMLTDITARKEAEQKLAASEQLFRTLVEHSPDYIARYDRELQRIYVNPALREQFAASSDQIIGTPPTDGYSPLIEPERYIDHIRQAIETAAECSDELTYRTAGGELRWATARFVPEFDSEGEVATVMVISSDDTERKLAEQERQQHADLLANTDRINRAIQGAGDLETMMRDALDEVLDIFDCDRAFLMYPCDPNAKSWTVPMERTRPAYPGVHALHEELPMDKGVAETLQLLLNTSGVLKFGPGTDRPLPEEVSARYGFKSFMSVALRPKVGKAWQFGIHQCSYERIWTVAEEQLLLEIGRRLGDALTSLLVLRDLRESERRLVDAQRLAHIGNWELDLVTNTLAWSDEIYRIFQMDKKKFGASYEAFLEAIHPDDREMVNQAYTDSLKTRQPYDIVHRLLLQGDRIKYVREMCDTVYDAAGNPLRSLGTVQDITEHKLREDELARYRDHLEDEVHLRTEDLRLARDAAEAANKAKSVFLANMSHELRTPLNAILGFSQMMQQDAGLSESQHDTLKIINSSGEHLLRLINDVLEIAKIEAGKLQLESATFDLQALVREVSDMMRLRAEQKGLRLKLDQSSDFPRYIKGDEARLRQILVNLVSNAVKFTEEGAVTLRLGVKGNGSSHLLIEVEDTGPGISTEDQQRLFKPFVQLSRGGVQDGTGLGLSIVRQFVILMGGHVVVESALGQGSLFRVVLPLQEAEADEVVRLAKEGHGTVVGLAPGQPAYRILIAEDQRDNQLLLTQLMTDLGLEVRVAENGEECVRMFRDWKPDLIWMDRRMPVMDGVEATRRIRQLPDGDKVKIVAVTASVFKEQQSDLIAAGMDDLIRKPFQFNEIYHCLAQQLGVEYLYTGASAQESSAVPLTPELLAGLGDEPRNELREALDSLDSERIEAAINVIAEKSPELAVALHGLAGNFDYPAILGVLESSATQAKGDE